MNKFFTENTAIMRLARTIVQGIIGALITCLPDLITGTEVIPGPYKALATAGIMAVLTPAMASVKEAEQEAEQEDTTQGGE